VQVVKGDREFIEAFRVAPRQRIRLDDIDARGPADLPDSDTLKEETARISEEIDRLQDRLYAEGKRALLVVLQGTDTAGKDGTVRGVFNTTGPLGVSVTAFRRPTENDLAYDYLRRVHLACPRFGTIGIFNRSHYEDVLVAKVRKLVPAHDIERRYEQINDFERMLSENGTRILKFMLHISKKEQAERLQERLDDPRKRWKFDPADLEDRKRWSEFQDAYETAIERCSTPWAPWHVVPADRKPVRNAIIARIVRGTLAEMDPRYPEPSWKPGDFSIR
jgi:PPK2 family polyphosphate:nucleotide phosphotransferase